MKDNINALDTVEKPPVPPAVEQEDTDTTMRTARSHVRSDVSRTWQMGPMGNFVTKSVMALGIVVGSAESSFARKWADNTGQHSVEADFVALKDGAVILRKEDGTEITVPLSRLSDDDLAYARQLAKRNSAPPSASTAEGKGLPKTKDLPKTKIWKDRLGNPMHATFVRMFNGNVIFRENNKIKSYPFFDLSAEDQEYVKRLIAADSPDDKVRETAPSKEPKSSKGRDLATAFSELDEKEKEKGDGGTDAMPDYIRERTEIYKDVENKSLDTRLQAIRELGTFKGAAAPALPFLRELLLQRDLEVREAAILAIVDIGAPAVPTLVAILESMKNPENFAMETVAGKAYDRARARNRMRRHWSGNLAEMAICALSDIGADAQEAIPLLLDLSLESDLNFKRRMTGSDHLQGTDATNYHQNALLIVQRLNPDLEAISPRLIEIIKVGIARKDDTSRAQARSAITMLYQTGAPPKEAVPVLLFALSDYSSFPTLTAIEIPIQIIEMLGRIGPDASAALPLLRSKLEHTHLGKSAEKAIAQITGTHAKDGSDATGEAASKPEVEKGEAASKPEVEKTDEAEYSFAEPTELPGALTWDLNDRDFKKWFKIIGKSYDEEKNRVRWDLEWKNSDNLTFGKVVSVRGLRFRFHFYDTEMNEVVVVRGKFSDPYGRVLLMEVPDKRALDKTNKVILRVTLR